MTPDTPPKKMSAEEMAEKLYDDLDWGCGCCSDMSQKDLKAMLAAALRQAHAAGRDEGLEEAAKRLYELGEEKYPKAVFQNEAGTFARHLLEVVLPDEIRALKTPEGGK